MVTLLIIFAVVAGLAVIYLILSVVVACILFRQTLLRPKEQPLPEDAIYKPLIELSQKAREDLKDVPFEDVWIRSADNLNLHGLYFDRHREKTVILAHGYMSQAEARLTGVKFYLERGFNALLVDSRAHGRSEGKYVSMGYFESQDLLLWVKYLERRNGICPVVLDGVSMGAATVLSVSLWDVPDTVRAIVADSAYTSAYEVFRHQIKYIQHLPSKPVLAVSAMIAKRKIGYGLKKNTPLDAVKRSHIPTLFIHGEKDSTVPFYMQKQLVEHCAAKKLYLAIKDAEHCTCITTAPAVYEATIDRFLRIVLENAETDQTPGANAEINAMQADLQTASGENAENNCAGMRQAEK